MKIRISALVAASLLTATTAIAGHEARALDDEQPGKANAMSCPDEAAQLVDHVLANLKVQMTAIHETDDPEERQRLLRNHLQTMQEALELLGPAHGSAPLPSRRSRQDKEMRGDGMMGGASMHHSLDQRVERLRQLIEQLIEHEEVESDDGEG